MVPTPRHDVPNPSEYSQPAAGAALQRPVTLGTLYPDAPTILVGEDVLEQILDYSEQQAHRELGGFLIGEHAAGERPRVQVQYFLPAVDTRSRAASLTFTHETWAALTADVERRYPDRHVVGWHHTHPNFGIFLSAYDRFIQQHFFDQLWQIALVVDPQRHEFGFFQWRNEQIVDCGFVLLPRNMPTPGRPLSGS